MARVYDERLARMPAVRGLAATGFASLEDLSDAINALPNLQDLGIEP